MKAALLLIAWTLFPITSDADENITVTIIGSVRNPGTFTLDGDRSVTGALNQAKCTLDSHLNRIRVLRSQPKEQVATYELRQFDPAADQPKTPFQLGQGDIVIVQSRLWDANDKNVPAVVNGDFYWYSSQIKTATSSTEFRRLYVKEYRDRLKAGWLGQIAGVSWGAPTEFKFRDQIMPASAMPPWQPRMINDAFGQDDLYVEMTFLRTLEQYGLDVSIRQAGIDFANSGYPLWCANDAGRKNLRRGIAPPDSSHPQFNKCPNDIDYQIEADFSGLIAPGLANLPIAMGEKFGRLMNYGDGMYAGQFIGAMYAEAFFEKDPSNLINHALRAIPADCQYAQMVRDVQDWRHETKSWEECWQLCQEKYRKNPEFQRASNGGIDCKINGAYILIGLLYGKGDLDETIRIACRCGQDSDCNPSSAAGILFTTLGYSKLPPRFTQALDEKPLFSHTAYNIPGLLDVCEKLARQAILKAGGKIEKDPNGEEYFLIPKLPETPSKLELSWAPGPIANSKFTADEMVQITASGTPAALRQAVEKFAPGWAIADCGTEMDPGLRAEEPSRQVFLVTHPLDRTTACVLSRKVAIPAGKTTMLNLTVGHHPAGDWDLVVRADMRELRRQTIGKANAPDGWQDVSIDLSEFAGQTVLLELFNQPTGWSWEAGYWAKIAIESK